MITRFYNDGTHGYVNDELIDDILYIDEKKIEYSSGNINISYSGFAFDRTIVFDESNIDSEFSTNSTNMETYRGYIKSLSYSDEAVSNTITQETGLPVFSVAHSIVVDYMLRNISRNSTADTLVTDDQLADGDKLIIKLSDGSIVEFVASGVTGSGPYQMDTSSITNGEVPTKVYRFNEKLIIGGIEAQEKKRTYYAGIIPKETVWNTTDVFEDGSGIGLWRLNGTVYEAENRYGGWGTGTYSFSGSCPFGGEPSFYTNRQGAVVCMLPELGDDLSISLHEYAYNPSSDSGTCWAFHLSHANQNTWCMAIDQDDVSGRDVWVKFVNNTKYAYHNTLNEYYNQWRHHVFTSAGATYDNQTKVDTTGGLAKSTFTDIDKPMLIGGDRDGDSTYNDFWSGHISQVRLFNKDLNDEEARYLYRELDIETFNVSVEYYQVEINASSFDVRFQMSLYGNRVWSSSMNIYRYRE